MRGPPAWTMWKSRPDTSHSCSVASVRSAGASIFIVVGTLLSSRKWNPVPFTAYEIQSSVSGTRCEPLRSSRTPVPPLPLTTAAATASPNRPLDSSEPTPRSVGW